MKWEKVGAQIVMRVNKLHYLYSLHFEIRKNNLIAIKKLFLHFSSAEPFLKKYGIEKAQENHQFVIVDVGDRAT